MHGLELEIHAALQRVHISAGDRRAVITEDHAAQDVQGGVGAHELVAALPIELAAHGACPRQEEVHRLPAGGAHPRRLCAPASRAPGPIDFQISQVSRLPTAARVKSRSI